MEATRTVEEVVTTKDGFRIVLDPQDNFICESIRRTGEWEPSVAEAIKAHLKPGWTFLDLGAHIGYFSLMAANMGNWVIAVEPNPIAYGFLHESRDLNEFYNIKIIHGAVADYTGFTHLQLVAGNTGEAHTSGADNTLPVRAYKPSAFLAGWPEFIKMDIEGDEYKVCKGEPDLLKYAKVVIFETHLRSIPADKDLVQLFKDNRFTLTQLHGGVYEDWLAVKS